MILVIIFGIFFIVIFAFIIFIVFVATFFYASLYVDCSRFYGRKQLVTVNLKFRNCSFKAKSVASAYSHEPLHVLHLIRGIYSEMSEERTDRNRLLDIQIHNSVFVR